MVEESFTYAEADVEARLLIEARNEADTVITHVERALAPGRALVGADERDDRRRRWQRSQRARGGSDRDLIRERTTALNQATEQLAEAHDGRGAQGRALASRRADEIMEPK